METRTVTGAGFLFFWQQEMLPGYPELDDRGRPAQPGPHHRVPAGR